MKQLDGLLGKSKGRFATGDQLTIADLQYYYEVTNLIVYERPFDEYENVKRWFGVVREVKEVR